MGTCGKTPRVDTASSSFAVETADQSSEFNVRFIRKSVAISQARFETILKKVKTTSCKCKNFCESWGNLFSIYAISINVF